MTSFRPLTGIVLACAMLFSSAPASAMTLYRYTSISTDSTSDAVSYVKNQGFMTGYSYGGFGEDNTLNRAEFAKVVTLIDNGSSASAYTLPFWDTAKNAWYTPYIRYVYGRGLMTGYSSTSFGPDFPVTFAEAAKVLATVYNLDANSSSGRWYEEGIRALDNENAIPTSIRGINDPLTRGELADIVYRLDAHKTNFSSQSYSDLVSGTSSNSHNTNGVSANCRGNTDLSISIDTGGSSVLPGDELTYGITVKNCTNDDQRVDVRAILDSQVSFDSASDNGDLNGSRVEWNNLWIDSGDATDLSLRVSVESYAGSNDSVDLDVRATDDNGHSDSVSKAFYLSGGNNNCYYDANNRYVCGNSNTNNNSSNCYYDSNNRYICSDNNSNCYYDSNNRYICNNNSNNSSNNCYYDSNGSYQCNNNNGGYYDNNCYYDSHNRYICDDNHSGNCYYNSTGNYTCPNSTTNNCYYDSSNHYVCNNNTNDNDNYNYNNNNSSDCYYDSNNRYICNNGNNGGGGYCYYDVYNNYICN